MDIPFLYETNSIKSSFPLQFFSKVLQYNRLAPLGITLLLATFLLHYNVFFGLLAGTTTG
ncbi:Leucine-responsive regulatory protein [Bacillus thuringiensis IBL 200]|nr:Leucine-responsive regulatory protein [Bacillus thuringiensis IBL 200]